MSEIRCKQNWFLLRPLSLACSSVSSPCVLTEASPCVLISSYKDTSSMRLRPSLRTSLSEKVMTTHSSDLAWKIPWMEEPGGLQSIGSLRVGHNWMTSLSLFTFMHWRRQWQPTPVFLPGESRGRGSLVGCRLWGRTESDTTEVTEQQQQQQQWYHFNNYLFKGPISNYSHILRVCRVEHQNINLGGIQFRPWPKMFLNVCMIPGT